jgi:hypothetical protein
LSIVLSLPDAPGMWRRAWTTRGYVDPASNGHDREEVVEVVLADDGRPRWKSGRCLLLCAGWTCRWRLAEDASPTRDDRPAVGSVEYFCPCPRVRRASAALQEIDHDDGAYGAYLAILGTALKERVR